MNFEKLTIKSQEALAGAQSLASEHGHQSIDDFHMLASFEQQDGIVTPVLQKLEVNIEVLKKMWQRL